MDSLVQLPDSTTAKDLSVTFTHACSEETYDLIQDFKSHNPFRHTAMVIEEECQYSAEISFMVITKLPVEAHESNAAFNQLAIMFYSDYDLINFCGYVKARDRQETIDNILSDL